MIRFNPTPSIMALAANVAIQSAFVVLGMSLALGIIFSAYPIAIYQWTRP